jgi:hypothetical protein
VDPTTPNTIYGGDQDNGTVRYNGTLGWSQIVGGDGVITRLANSSTLYQEQFGVSLTSSVNPQQAPLPTFNLFTSGIKSHTQGTPPMPIVNSLAPYVLDSSGDILFGTDYLNLWTKQGGWTQIGSPKTNGFNPNDSPIDAIAVAPSNKAVVYAAVGGTFDSKGNPIPLQFFVTKNATDATATPPKPV